MRAFLGLVLAASLIAAAHSQSPPLPGCFLPKACGGADKVQSARRRPPRCRAPRNCAMRRND
jgi:hypothetical protein